jgi:hypothetical protein
MRPSCYATPPRGLKLSEHGNGLSRVISCNAKKSPGATTSIDPDIIGPAMLIKSGSITTFFLFDVASEIDMTAVPRLLHTTPTPARLEPKPHTPAYLQYRTPPLVIEGEALDLPDIAGCRVRVKVYHYGIISVALSRPFAGSWTELMLGGQQMSELEGRAASLSAGVAAQLGPALAAPRPPGLTEDYLVFAVTQFEEPLIADDLLARHGEAIAALLRAEHGALSTQERDEVLRHRLSYLAEDLVVPTWNAALVCDTDAGVQAALEIFEFANAQLLEFRYYDGRLESELDGIYDSLERPRWYDRLVGRRLMREAYKLHALFIDVNELTDKTENAIKMVGDVYATRLYALVSARLGLERWKANVEDKLQTLDDIYRFTVEQTQMSRANLMELTIVLILVLELTLVLLGLMK